MTNSVSNNYDPYKYTKKTAVALPLIGYGIAGATYGTLKALPAIHCRNDKSFAKKRKFLEKIKEHKTKLTYSKDLSRMFSVQNLLKGIPRAIFAGLAIGALIDIYKSNKRNSNIENQWLLM